MSYNCNNISTNHSSFSSQSTGFRQISLTTPTCTSAIASVSSFAVSTPIVTLHQQNTENSNNDGQGLLSSNASPNANANSQAFSVFANVNIPERSNSSFKWPMSYPSHFGHLNDSNQSSSALLINTADAVEVTSSVVSSTAPTLPKKPSSFTPTTQIEFGTLLTPSTASTSTSVIDNFNLPDIVDSNSQHHRLYHSQHPHPSHQKSQFQHHAHNYHHQHCNSINDNGFDTNLASQLSIMHSAVISPRREHHHSITNYNLSSFQSSNSALVNLSTTLATSVTSLPTPTITAADQQNLSGNGNHFR